MYSRRAGGKDIAYDPQFTTSADKFGQIIVQFIYGGADQPFINGIEAVQSGNPSCSAIPSAPTGVTTSGATSSSLNVSWTAVTPPANCSISSYNVYGGTTANPTTLIASGLTGTTYSNTGLAASTTYYYVVKAVDADGTSGPSAQGERYHVRWHLQHGSFSADRTYGNSVFLKRNRLGLDGSNSSG